MTPLIVFVAMSAFAVPQDAGTEGQREAERAARCHAISNRADKLLAEQAHLIAPAALDALEQVGQLQSVLESWGPAARNAAGWDASRYYARMGHYHDTEIDTLSHIQLAEALKACLTPA